MYIKEKIKNHFLNLLEDKDLAMIYFYNKDIVEEFNNNKLVELQNNVKKSENKYNKLLNLYSLAKFLGIESLIEKANSNLNKAQRTYNKNMHELDIFKSNLAYLLISGILKLENAQAIGYSIEFINEFLVPYKNQAENPYNEYYYNESNGRTTKIDEKGHRIILPYTPYIVSKKISEKEYESYVNGGISSLKKLRTR